MQSPNVKTYYTPSNRNEVNGIVERFHSTIAEIFQSVKTRYEGLAIKNSLNFQYPFTMLLYILLQI